MEIHSESIRTIPIHSDICIWANANHSKPIRLIPRHQSEWIRTNPKPSFQSELIRINPKSEWFGLILIENSVWINPRSDRFRLIWIEKLVSDWFGMIRIDSEWISMRYFHQGKLEHSKKKSTDNKITFLSECVHWN